MKGTNVAIFVPHAGCAHRCTFCDQRGISGAGCIPDSEEVAAILARAAESLGERTHSSEIAFFGGSFTAIPRNEMLRLLETAKPFLGENGFAGVRISTRPDAVGAAELDILAQYGVTSIELGAQSMDDAVLAAVHRGHTSGDVAAASRRIRERGFSLGLQMMTGLPGDSDAGALRTAAELAALGPDTIRVYPTLVLRNTPLAALWREGAYCPQDIDQAAALGAALLEYFDRRGIRVIRLGLHDAPTLRRDLLAGPHHPAFRELCEGRVLLDKVLPALAGSDPGPVVLTVAKGSTSKMAGQKRANLLELERLGYPAKITESTAVPYLAVQIERR